MGAEALIWSVNERTGRECTVRERTGLTLPDGHRADHHLAAAQRALGRFPGQPHAALRATVQALPMADDAPLLALFGLAPALAEPVTLLAEILGWRVVARACGGTIAARLCLAMLPAEPGELPPLLAWCPDNNLNEHISHHGLSRMEQPCCVSRVELLLQIAGRL